MVKNKNTCDIYYARTFVGLITILALLFKKKNSNRKILFISNSNSAAYKKQLDKKILIFFKNFYQQYFDEIHYVNYSRISKTNASFFVGFFERCRQIKINQRKIILKLNKNLKVANIYAGGDDFEILLLNKLGYFPKFHYLEHGYGPLRDAINFTPRIKHLIFNFVIKILYKLNFLSYYPIKYESYVGFLAKNFNNKKFINFRLIKKNINLELSKILLELSLYVKKKINLKKKKFKYVLFNYSAITISDDKLEFQSLLKKIASLIDKKRECVLIKGHPVISFTKTEDFIKSMIIFFKKNNIKYHLIKRDKFLNKLPSQLIVELFKIKKIFSDLSSPVFHLSNSNKKIKGYVPLNYALKNISTNQYKSRDEKWKDFYYTMGKKVKFI